MTKSNGIKSLKQAAKLLNKHAPEGESLAYINPTEARILKAYGGSGIMTLAGIPSYEPWYKKLWGGITDAASWVGENIFGYGDQTVLDKSGKAVQVAGRSPFQDAISVYAFLRAKKDQEGLNAAEQSEFNRLNQQLTAGREEFKGYTGGGEHLTAPTNVPETIEDVSVFKETTGRPDMVTTAAHGGRIGYNIAGPVISKEQDAMVKDMLNKNMDISTISTITNITEDQIKMIINQINEAQKGIEQSGALDNLNLKAQGGRIGYDNGGMSTMMAGSVSQDDMLNDLSLEKFNKPVKELTPPELREFWEEVQRLNTKVAQGGRIGYNMGGIDTPFQGIGALNPRMGYQGGMTVEEMGVDYSNPNEMITSKEAWLGDKQGMEEVMTTEDIKERFRNIKMAWPEISDEQALRKAMKGSGTNFYDLFAGSSNLSEGIDPRMISEMMQRDWDNQSFDDRQTGLGSAQGGRIGAQSGGIMPLLNMGGMEKDYRQDGGFVPIGRKEKADDVPARLSKNEFVFTADAVRAAGGGDIDQGAQRMYNVMKNLEAGGDISEQSQGKA